MAPRRKYTLWLLLLGVHTLGVLVATPNTGVESADTVLEKEERDALLKSSFDTRMAFLQERRAQIMATPPPDPEREPFATRVVSFDDLNAIEWSVLFSLREFPEKADLALQEMTEWLPFRWTIESDGLRGGRDGVLTPVPGFFSSYGDKGRAKLIEVFDKSPDEGVRRLAFQKLSQWGRSQGHVEPWLQELWDRTPNRAELLEPVMTVIFDRAAAKEGLPPFRETIKKQAAERDAKLMAQAEAERNVMGGSIFTIGSPALVIKVDLISQETRAKRARELLSARSKVTNRYDLEGMVERARMAAQAEPSVLEAVERFAAQPSIHTMPTMHAIGILLNSESPDLHCFGIIHIRSQGKDETRHYKVAPRHLEGVALAAEQSRRVLDGVASTLHLGDRSGMAYFTAIDCLALLDRIDNREPEVLALNNRVQNFTQTFGVRFVQKLKALNTSGWNAEELAGRERALQILGVGVANKNQP